MAGCLRGKALKPSSRRRWVEGACKEYKLSVQQACCLFKLSHRMYYYKRKSVDDGELITVLKELAYRYPSYGYWKLYYLLRQQGYEVNHKKIYKHYKEYNLAKRRKCKRKRLTREKLSPQQTFQPNVCCSIDFMSDCLLTGKRFQTFHIIDEFNREALEIDTSLLALHVVHFLEKLNQRYGKPQCLRMDNGTELTSTVIREWAKTQGITLKFIQTGKPTQNAYIERFNGTYRYEVLDAYRFRSLSEARQITAAWLNQYNHERPHAALNYLTPTQYKEKYYLENSSD